MSFAAMYIRFFTMYTQYLWHINVFLKMKKVHHEIKNVFVECPNANVSHSRHLMWNWLSRFCVVLVIKLFLVSYLYCLHIFCLVLFVCIRSLFHPTNWHLLAGTVTYLLYTDIVGGDMSQT